jgi:GR25 family glycosyltransferase involved in LPS biosynthesis
LNIYKKIFMKPIIPSFAEYLNESINLHENVMVYESDVFIFENENKSDDFHLNNVVDAIYVINLSKRKDRLEKFKENAKEFAVKFTKITAIEGDKLPKKVWIEAAKEARAPKRQKTHKGEPYQYVKSRNHIACSMSHIKCIEDAYEKGYKYVCIMEDDTHFLDSFNEEFKAAWDELPKPFDYFGFWMGGKSEKEIEKGKYKEKSAGKHITQILKGGYGLVGYIANVNRFYKMQHADGFEPRVMDRQVPEYFHEQGKSYYMTKKCIKFINDMSDIEKVKQG